MIIHFNYKVRFHILVRIQILEIFSQTCENYAAGDEYIWKVSIFKYNNLTAIYRKIPELTTTTPNNFCFGEGGQKL